MAIEEGSDNEKEDKKESVVGKSDGEREREREEKQGGARNLGANPNWISAKKKKPRRCNCHNTSSSNTNHCNNNSGSSALAYLLASKVNNSYSEKLCCLGKDEGQEESC